MSGPASGRYPRAFDLPSDTTVGAVRLRVADLAGVAGYYESTLGLIPAERENGMVRLGPEGGPPLLELVSAPDAPPRPACSTGLFHVALLVPTRAGLAQALRRIATAGGRLMGASDHLVSEALYLRDPEGNGIEVYRDRPREEWKRHGGEIEMATLPLDLDGVMGALEPGEDAPGSMAPGTRMGHVHLEVSDIAPAERFYAGALGLDVTVRSYPGALFVSAGGYHHHVGLNTWQAAGAPPPPEGALGLDHYELVLPTPAERDAAAGRLAGAGGEPVEVEGGVRATDPSGNAVLLTAARS